MQFLAFSSIVILLSYSNVVMAEVFNIEQCVQSEFNTTVTHKGWPFGMHDVVLKLDKKQCKVLIDHEHFKYLKKSWEIDVCRGPVHIKMGTDSVEVFKRISSCNSGSSESSGYCSRYKNLTQVLQDDGLIFANGHKEDLSTDHGRVNCVFKLVKQYLNEGFVFSLHKSNQIHQETSHPQIFADDSNTDRDSSDGNNNPIPASGMPADF